MTWKPLWIFYCELYQKFSILRCAGAGLVFENPNKILSVSPKNSNSGFRVFISRDPRTEIPMIRVPRVLKFSFPGFGILKISKFLFREFCISLNTEIFSRDSWFFVFWHLSTPGLSPSPRFGISRGFLSRWENFYLIKYPKKNNLIVYSHES